MANTYTQIHIHVVFAVHYRKWLIQYEWEDELYKYMTGIVQNQGHKLLQINGMPDHIHMLIGMRPIQSLSKLMKKVKMDSSKWINEKQLVKGEFKWKADSEPFLTACPKCLGSFSISGTRKSTMER